MAFVRGSNIRQQACSFAEAEEWYEWLLAHHGLSLLTDKASTATKSAPRPATSPAPSDASESTIGDRKSSSSKINPDKDAPSPLHTPNLDPRLFQHPYDIHNGFPVDTIQFMSPEDQFEGLSQSFQSSLPLSTTPSTNNTMVDEHSTFQSSMTAPSTFSSSQSPKLIDLLLPGTDLNAPPPDFMDFGPQQSEMPYQPGGNPDDMLFQDNDVEEIVRRPNPDAEAWIMRLPSPSPSSSSSSSDGSRFDSLNAIYRQPHIHPGSPEMLMLRFDRQTCGILSVKDGPNENPWRTLVWPLAQDSPALYHAISSMTAFHTSKAKPEMRVEGMEHMRRSIRSLATGIESMRTDTALATTLVLAFSESWDQHTSTGIEHLRGAKVLVNQALTKHRQDTLSGQDLVRLKFLCNTWVYMDVIARLTSIDDDESTDFDAVLCPSSGPLALNNEVDPLMGCASTLFPLIGRVANLVRRVRKSSSNSIAIISHANDLKIALEGWKAPAFFEPPEDPTSEIQHSLQTAEAYRWATLLYLHQAVPEIPSLPAAQLAKKVLVYLATVPLASRAIIVQIYPLLAAGCEAIGPEDRAWIEDRWAAMASRMWIGNIDRCWEVIKEVWDRRDSDDADKYRQQFRRVTTRLPSGFTPPVETMKRKFSGQEQFNFPFMDWSDAFGGSKRRATQRDMGTLAPTRINISRRQSNEMMEKLEFEKTVRGRQHWAGVMKDWGWEGEIGCLRLEELRR